MQAKLQFKIRAKIKYKSKTKVKIKIQAKFNLKKAANLLAKINYKKYNNIYRFQVFQRRHLSNYSMAIINKMAKIIVICLPL